MLFVGVFGNNDQEEKEGLIAASENLIAVFFEEPYLLNIKEKKIYILHHPDLINKNMSIKGDFMSMVILIGTGQKLLITRLFSILVNVQVFLEGKNKIGLLDLEKNSKYSFF